jgi:hypothetical protein
MMLLLAAGSLFAQGEGPLVNASKDDWEEINFETNSSKISDGFPALLRMAELLKANPGWRLAVTGHTDGVGSHPLNDKLALARARAVKAFLEKYGANPNQITASGSGKRNPKVDNATKEGRFINRRVEMTLRDEKGNIIKDRGSLGETVSAADKLLKQSEECCNLILKRLDKLEEIMAELRQLRNENKQILDELAKLRGAGAPASAAAAGPAPAPAPGPSPAQLSQVADDAARKAVDQVRRSGGLGEKFSILGLNAGPDGNGDVTMSGRARYFGTFGTRSALQAQGEYMYFRDRREGQFDIGLVNRFGNFQMGGFTSFRNIWMKNMDSTGTLGQASFTGDYLFGMGKVGLFGVKTFLNDAVIKTVAQRNVVTETYLHAVDQLGASGTVAFGKTGRSPWLEGNIGWLKSARGNAKAGGTARLVFPVNDYFALSAEGGVNETLIGASNNGRAVFGILFGNYTHPKDFTAVDHPVPVDIPRVRYEMLTRTRRTGNDPPVADAGPDQIGARAGNIQLDGSGSFDPDGDPITFQWQQIAGPAVALANATTARPSFTAADGQTYSFRLTVRDDKNAQGIARVTITTREPSRVRILRFTANPTLIQRGQSSVLNYLVENAETVTISGVNQSLNPASGAVSVSPTQTTSYTLTARNANSEEVAVAVVAVESVRPQFVSCSASPASILPGESATINWRSENAQSVEVVGVGSFAPTGSTVVSPTASTTYTLIARGEGGEATCTATVQVQTGPGPSILVFKAEPIEIVEGESSTLSWNVENSTDITITAVGGGQPASGSAPVTPATTTTYVLTARNPFGTRTASATVTVIPRVKLISFTASPDTITAGGTPITFRWQTENAVEVFITEGIGTRAPNGSLTNAGPLRTTTYMITAIGRGRNNTATGTVTVTLTSGPPPANRPPTANIPTGNFVTATRNIVLNGAGSFDPDGDPLTYRWRSVDGRASISNPTDAIAYAVLTDTNYGEFVFELTVTDSKGASATQTVIVTLVQYRPIR